MSRTKTPLNILKLRGSFNAHPERLKERENEPVCTKNVGKPPDNLSEIEQAAFNEIVKLAIDGVLTEADSLAIEQAAILLIKCRSKKAAAAEQNQFFKYLSQFGMTPADRGKISMPKEKSKSTFDE